MLSPTDCVKDRLCGFFHWNDRQSLDQAIMVAQRKKVDMGEIERWAVKERMREQFIVFKSDLAKRSKEKR